MFSRVFLRVSLRFSRDFQVFSRVLLGCLGDFLEIFKCFLRFC